MKILVERYFSKRDGDTPQMSGYRSGFGRSRRSLDALMRRKTA